MQGIIAGAIVGSVLVVGYACLKAAIYCIALHNLEPITAAKPLEPAEPVCEYCGRDLDPAAEQCEYCGAENR